MSVDSKGFLFGAFLLCCFQVVMAAEDNTAVIVAGIVAGLFVIIFVIGISIFCLYRQGAFKNSSDHKKKKKRPHRHERYMNGGVHAHQQPVIKPYKIPYPPPEQPVFHVPYSPPKYQKHQNGFVPAPVMDPRVVPPIMHPNTTYHGPPPGFEQTPPVRPGTFSGAPPVTYVKYGNMQFRADPKPVMKKSRRKERQPITVENDHVVRRSKSKDRSRNQPQEYIIQPSYDGVPVIRPVIYLDEEEHKRKSRSKSREPRESRHRHKSRESPTPNVTEVRLETENPTSLRPPSPTMEPPPRSRSPTPPRPPKSPLVKSSRASSVTEAVNALRMSVKDTQGDGMSDTTSHSSGAPSFGWTRQEPPEPAAGDVMFYPAGKQVPETSTHARSEKKDDVYGYAHVIKSPSDSDPIRQSVARATVTNGGYQEPSALSQTGTRDGPSYETEHSRVSAVYGGGIGASMSERLTSLVEDGDRSRFNHYNIGAVDLGPEEEEEDVDPVQLRVRRPDTPPSDIPRDSALYADVVKPTRPQTPPSDFPLVTPRESTEIPPLNLASTVNSPRPDTPPQDFPITPKPSFTRARPPTPPYDVETSRSNVGDSNPYLVPNTGRSLAQSLAADPNTGEPGSFQARQRLIEAHLKKNAPDAKTSSVKFNQKTELIPRSQQNTPRFPDPLQSVAPPPPPQAPPVNITPGVIPPAPPPPPPPPPPPMFK